MLTVSVCNQNSWNLNLSEIRTFVSLNFRHPCVSEIQIQKLGFQTHFENNNKGGGGVCRSGNENFVCRVFTRFRSFCLGFRSHLNCFGGILTAYFQWNKSYWHIFIEILFKPVFNTSAFKTQYSSLQMIILGNQDKFSRPARQASAQKEIWVQRKQKKADRSRRYGRD